MIKKFTFGIITMMLISCGVDHTDFSGDWIDKKNESDRMIITKNGDNYIVESRNKKFPAQIKDGLLEISTELPSKATIDANDILIIAGNEYIRFEKSKLYSFVGKWETIYFVNNGKDKMDFVYKTGITGNIIINPDLKVNYEDFTTSDGKIFDANSAFKEKPLFGNLNTLYFEKNTLRTIGSEYIQLSITDDNYLKISSPNDTDYTLLKKKWKSSIKTSFMT